jgi:hypothetical protein
MATFTQWFESHFASFSTPSLSRLIINRYHILYYSFLFFIIFVLLSSAFHLAILIYYYCYDSRTLQRMCISWNSHFGRSKFAHYFTYFTPDTNPDVNSNYFCPLEYKLNVHNSRVFFSGDINTNGFDGKRGLSIPNCNFYTERNGNSIYKSTCLLNLRQHADVAVICWTWFYLILVTRGLLLSTLQLWSQIHITLIRLSTYCWPLLAELKITRIPTLNLSFSRLVTGLSRMIPPLSILLSPASMLVFKIPWNMQFSVASSQSQNSEIDFLFFKVLHEEWELILRTFWKEEIEYI